MVFANTKGLRELQNSENLAGNNEEPEVLIGSIKVEFSRLAKMFGQIETLCSLGEQQGCKLNSISTKDTM